MILIQIYFIKITYHFSFQVPDTEASDANGIRVNVESDRIHVKALVVGEYIDSPSHYQVTFLTFFDFKFNTQKSRLRH